MSRFDRAHTSFYLTFDRKCASVLYRFRDIASYLSKVTDFNPPTCICRPQTPVEFRRDLCLQKTRVPALSCGVVSVIPRLAVLVEHRLVTDGQTDGRTDGRTDTWLVPRMHSIAR